MQARHRIPTIFNLSMVDVLCCALGCVILLWLVYFKEARTRAFAVKKTDEQLQVTKLKLDNVLRDLTSTQQSLITGNLKNEHLSGQLLEIMGQRSELLAKWEKTDKQYQAAQQNLKDATQTVATLQQDLRALEKLTSDQKSAIAAATNQTTDLKAKLSGSEKRAGALQQQVGTLEPKLSDAEKRAVGYQQQVATLQTKLTEAEKQSGTLQQQIATLELLSKDYGAQLGAVESKAMRLESDLDKRKLDLAEANKRLDDLQTLRNLLEQSLAATKTDLAKSNAELSEAKLANHGLVGETKILGQQLNKLKAAAENRFAGIELTGSRVLFLVDMSGSMRMKDDYVEDPDKWPLVCEILGKLIQSLPDLKQFQIIMFSDTIRYPLGTKGKWHDFTGPASVKSAIAAVRAISPQNETNMSNVFEEAFKYRAMGLDTIYMLSDGLPNAGVGLPANSAKLSDTEKGVLLGKYIRDRLKTTWNTPVGAAKQRVRINTVGFYFDSPDVGAFLWALARDNDGSFVGLSKP